MLVTTKQKMYLTMHGIVEKGETIDIPEDVINDFGKDCFEFAEQTKKKSEVTEESENGGETSPEDEQKPKKTSKKKTDTTEE